MRNEYDKKIEDRIKKLEKDSHPPVDWQELIYANIERIDHLEDTNEQLLDIIKHITRERKELKEKVELMEKIISDTFEKN
tara:strand:- start:31004 stop:31243 length:240 start_codon:yes stop_codon:yes gene_type:complete